LETISKQTVRILHVNQSSLTAANRPILQMQTDSVFYLTSLSFDACMTTSARNQSANEANHGTKHTIYHEMGLPPFNITNRYLSRWASNS